MGLIPGLGRCPGEGNGNPLQYSFLENPMDRGAWRGYIQSIGRKESDVTEAPQHTHTYMCVYVVILVPYSLIVFFCLGRCLSTCKGPRSRLSPHQSLHILHLTDSYHHCTHQALSTMLQRPFHTGMYTSFFILSSSASCLSTTLSSSFLLPSQKERCWVFFFS